MKLSIASALIALLAGISFASSSHEPNSKIRGRKTKHVNGKQDEDPRELVSITNISSIDNQLFHLVAIILRLHI